MLAGKASDHWNMYRIKRAVLAPYIWYMRRKHRDVTGIAKHALEIVYYSPSVFQFFDAVVANPNMLYEAPNLTADSVVFDVGGFDGDWSAKVFDKYGAHIYCFEVSPDFCKTIAARFESNDRVKCLDFGLGGENATLPLALSDMGSTLYTLEGEAPHPTAETTEVLVRDIVEVMDELALKQVDLLKLNIEGGEYDVLERLIEAGRLKDIACLTIQFHEWLDRAGVRRRKIREALRKTHREVWGYAWCWEQWVRKDT